MSRKHKRQFCALVDQHNWVIEHLLSRVTDADVFRDNERYHDEAHNTGSKSDRSCAVWQDGHAHLVETRNVSWTIATKICGMKVFICLQLRSRVMPLQFLSFEETVIAPKETSRAEKCCTTEKKFPTFTNICQQKWFDNASWSWRMEFAE